MTADHPLENELETWLAHRTSTPSPEILPRVVARIARVDQRPGFLTRDRYDLGVPRIALERHVAAATATLVVVLATALAVGLGGVLRPSSSAFATTGGLFAPSDSVAFRAAVEPVAGVPAFNWRAGTYAEYLGSGWGWGAVDRLAVAASEPIDARGLENSPVGSSVVRVHIVVTPDSFAAPTVLGPSGIKSIGEPVDAVVQHKGGWLTSIERHAGSASYTLTAVIRIPDGAPGELNEATLRSAGTSYPAGILDTYTALPEGAVGPASRAVLEAVRAAVPDGLDAANPYDLARTMEAYLADADNFTYATDVRAEVAGRCAGMSTAECFATIRRGYCDYFATTMAVLLRESGVPARIAYGFLGGDRNADGTEVVEASLAHWWVEVYFPGVGWFPFDPTGGGVGRPHVLPQGR